MTHHTRLTRRTILGSLLAAGLVGCGNAVASQERFPLMLSEAEWRRRLSPPAFSVLRRASTERSGSSPLNAEHRSGTYHCAGCNNPLYASTTKFESGTGWPSFYEPIHGAIGTRPDRTLFGVQTEVHCARCGGHLGHVFDDGPQPTGLRYCMNGVAMIFRPAARV